MSIDTLPRLKEDLRAAQEAEIAAAHEVAIAKQRLQYLATQVRGLARTIQRIERARAAEPLL